MFKIQEDSSVVLSLGQSWWRKIRKQGLSVEYKNKECEIELWLTKLFGLSFLDPTTIDDCFAEEMYEDIPNIQCCAKIADYLVETYISPESISLSQVSVYIYRQQNPCVH